MTSLRRFKLILSNMSTHVFAYLHCRILESKSAYFIEHSVVEKEVDSIARSWFLS